MTIKPSANHSSRIYILQRVVSHYRVPLFDALHHKLGWRIFTSTNFPKEHASLNVVENYHAADETAFFYPKKTDPYLCWVPLRKLFALNPRLVVVEAGSKMSSTWFLALYARFNPWRNVKIIFWGHGKPVAFATSDFKRKLVAKLKKGLLNSVDGYLCYSEEDRAYLKAIGVRKPVYISYNSIDIRPALQLRDLSKYQENEAPHLLAVGRLLSDKNVNMLIMVFLEFLKKHPKAQLTIVGDGPEKEQLQDLSGKMLGVNIHFTGAIYEEESLAEHFNKADVFVTCGAVGLGVNHALAYGVPVLAFQQTEAGPFHHPEICYVEEDKTGWKVSRFTEQAMLEHLVKLFQKGQNPRQLLQKTLPEYAEEQLSLDKMTEVFKQIQVDMLGASSVEML